MTEIPTKLSKTRFLSVFFYALSIRKEIFTDKNEDMLIFVGIRNILKL